MLIPVHDQTVINLIGENDQLMLSCDLYDLLQDLLRIYRTCRIIRINDNDGLGLICDLASDVINIRISF